MNQQTCPFNFTSLPWLRGELCSPLLYFLLPSASFFTSFNYSPLYWRSSRSKVCSFTSVSEVVLDMSNNTRLRISVLPNISHAFPGTIAYMLNPRLTLWLRENQLLQHVATHTLLSGCWQKLVKSSMRWVRVPTSGNLELATSDGVKIIEKLNIWSM